MRRWALGKQSKPYFGFEWAKHWGTPLTEVRKLLGVDVALHEAEIPEQQSYVYRAAA